MRFTIPALLTLLATTFVAANPLPIAASSMVPLEDIYGGTCYLDAIDTLPCKKAGYYPAGCCCKALQEVVNSCGLPGPPYTYSTELKNAFKKCNQKCYT